MTGPLGLEVDAAAPRDYAELDLEHQFHFEERLQKLYLLSYSAKHEKTTLALVNCAEKGAELLQLSLRMVESFVVQRGTQSANADAAAMGAHDKYQNTGEEEVSLGQGPSPR